MAGARLEELAVPRFHYIAFSDSIAETFQVYPGRTTAGRQRQATLHHSFLDRRGGQRPQPSRFSAAVVEGGLLNVPQRFQFVRCLRVQLHLCFC